MSRPRARALLASLALAAGCLGANPYRRMAKDLSAPLTGTKRRVAVLPFRGVDPALDAEGEAISERLLTHLYGRKGIELIERSHLQQVMSEMSLRSTGALDGKTATEVGRLVGAQALVVGTLARASKGLEAAARVVDVESGRVLAAAGGRFPDARNGARTPPPSIPSRGNASGPALPSARASETPGSDLGPGDRAPRAQAVFGAAALGKRIYVFGGATDRVAPGQGERSAYSSLVGADGRLGRWRAEEPLPEGRYQIGAAAWNRRVFAVGGYGGAPRSEVFAAEAGSDGRLAAWKTVGRLPRGCTNPTALAAGGRLYVAGCSDAGGLSDEVLTAPIDAEGVLGEWVVVRLPEPAGNCSLAFDGERILVMGGLKEARAFSSAVYAVSLVKEGRTPSVKRVGSLPVAAAAFPAVVSDGRLWILGGLTNGGVRAAANFCLDGLQSAAIVRDGGLGPWRRSGSKLVPAAFNSSAAFVGGAFFMVGGETMRGRSDVVQRVPVRALEGH